MPQHKTMSVHSVERALAILEYLNDSRDSRRHCSLSQLSRFLKLPKSTAHMLILTLARHGYVVREEGGRNYLAQQRFYNARQLRFRSAVLGEETAVVMHRLMCVTGLTVHLTVEEQGQMMYIQKVPSTQAAMDTFEGKHANLHCTAGGKVILAYGDEQTLQTFLARRRFTRHTENTI